jgi:hypothetical protein
MAGCPFICHIDLNTVASGCGSYILVGQTALVKAMASCESGSERNCGRYQQLTKLDEVSRDTHYNCSLKAMTVNI